MPRPVTLSVEQWRQRFCWSRRDLAKRANVSPVTIWRIERAKHVPIPLTRRQIAAAFGCDHQAIAWPTRAVS